MKSLRREGLGDRSTRHREHTMTHILMDTNNSSGSDSSEEPKDELDSLYDPLWD